MPMRNRILLAVLLCLVLPEWAAGQILLSRKLRQQTVQQRLAARDNLSADIPITLLANTFLTHGKKDTLQVMWLPRDLRCRLRYAARPGGREPANYPGEFSQVGQGELLLTEAASLDVGLYYCILQSVEDPEQTSIEFTVVVQPETPVRLLGPVEKVSFEPPGPIFQWEPIQGVPYYFIMVSKGDLEIDTDPETGEIRSLRNVNIIWQAFTDRTSIRYGDADISGIWPVDQVVPLWPGEKYYWIVFSAFGPGLPWVAWELHPLNPPFFEVNANANLASPRLITPLDNEPLFEPEIRFAWHPVAGAQRYRVVLYETYADEQFGEGTLLIWQHTTLDTQATFWASPFLAQSRYVVQVTAEAEGKAVASAPRAFFYFTDKGYVEIKTYNRETGTDLPFVDLRFRRRSGSGLPLPYFTGEYAYFANDLAAGEYLLTAKARNFLKTEVPLQVAPFETTFVRLLLPPAPFELHGRLTSADGGPVIAPKFQVRPGSQQHVSFNNLGDFFIDSGLPVSSMRIAAPGYMPVILSGFDYGTNGFADVGEIVLQPADAQISGQLQDASGMPVTGAYLLLEGMEDTLTVPQSAAGRYEVRLPAGDWTLRPVVEGFYSQPEIYHFDLTPGQRREVNFVFFAGALLEGRVWDGDEPRAHIDVRLISGQTVLHRRSDAYGSFRFDARPGTYHIEIDQAGFGPVSQTVTLRPGEVTRADVHLIREAVVFGRVQRARTAQPLSGAEIVEVNRGQVLATTAADGSYQFSLPGDTTLLLDARLQGFVSPGPQSVTVSGNDSVRVDFTLEPASAVISGQVLRNGQPVAGARVMLTELQLAVLTDAGGYFSFEVAPGNYHIQAQYQCLQSDLVLVSVDFGTAANIVLELTGQGVLFTGQVTDTRGQPLPDASVLASRTSTYSARSDSSGAFELCLQPGPYFVLVSRVGYQNADTTLLVNESDSLIVIHFRLKDNFATLRGRVLDSEGAPLPDVDLLLTNFWQQLTTRSDSSGNYEITGIYPGESTLLARSERFFAPPVTLFLTGKEERVLDIRMFANDGYLAGNVIRGADSSGIDSALVVAQLEGSGAFFSALSSGPAGAFRIENVPNFSEARYRLVATRKGFVLDAPVTGVPPNSENLQLVMLSSEAEISGVVMSDDTHESLAGVEVQLQQLQEGPPKSMLTGADGKFRFSRLIETRDYRISFSHAKFFPAALQVAAPQTGLTVLLRRRLTFAAGRVIHRDSGAGFAGARVVFINLDGEGRNDTTITAADGTFELKLWPGDYQVSASAPLYFSDPPLRTISAAPGDTVSGLDFRLEKQALQALFLSGPTEIVNRGEKIQYRVEAVDTSGRGIREVPGLQWWTTPGPDTARIDSSGMLQLQPGYADAVVVGVRDTVSGAADSLEVTVSVAVDSASDLVLFSRSGMELHIVPGALSQSTGLRLEVGPISPVQNLEEKFRILPPLYRMIPQNLFFAKEIRLSVPIPEEVAGKPLRLLRWNANLSEWETEGAAASQSFSGKRLERMITRSGSYAIAELSKPLGIEFLELKPNPFAPGRPNAFGGEGLAIHFSVTSNQAALPLVTARIYNLQGSLVAILANQKPVSKGPQLLFWDGTTLDGRQARNGRYILRFSVEDGRHKQEILKSIVLIQ